MSRLTAASKAWTCPKGSNKSIFKPPVQWTAGYYYSGSWTDPAITRNNGTEDSTLGVQFSRLRCLWWAPSAARATPLAPRNLVREPIGLLQAGGEG